MKHHRRYSTIIIILLAASSCNHLQEPTGSVTVNQSTQSQMVLPVETMIATSTDWVEPVGISFFDRSPSGTCSWYGQSDGDVFMYLPDIYAIDQNTAFLYGSLDNSSGTVKRSLLLRTEDGGRNWQEVMAPIDSFSIQSLSFIDEMNGWALAVYSIESPGDISLYRTQDGGKSWFELTAIDAGQYHHGVGTPGTVQFQDEQNGRILIGYEQNYSVLDSTDGGVTWVETDWAPFDQYPLSLDVLKGRGGNLWRIDVSELLNDDHLFFISRYLSSSDDYGWVRIGSIPLAFAVREGCIQYP